MGLFFWAYLFLLKNPAFPVTTIPLTIVDHWVGFAPLALVPFATSTYTVALLALPQLLASSSLVALPMIQRVL